MFATHQTIYHQQQFIQQQQLSQLAYMNTNQNLAAAAAQYYYLLALQQQQQQQPQPNPLQTYQQQHQFQAYSQQQQWSSYLATQTAAAAVYFPQTMAAVLPEATQSLSPVRQMSAPIPTNTPQVQPPTLSPLQPHETLLYIANLPFHVTEQQLKDWVVQESQATAILNEVMISQRKTKEGVIRSRGLAFAKINTEQVPTILALGGHDFHGRQFDVQVSRNQAVTSPAMTASSGLVRSVTSRDEVKQPPLLSLSGSASPIAMPRIRRGPLLHESPMSSLRLLSVSPSLASSSCTSASASLASSPKSLQKKLSPPTLTSELDSTTHTLLYINNLPFDTTAEQILTLFSEALGDPVNPPAVEIVHSKFGKFKGRSRGFGFVRVLNDQAETALKLHQHLVGDRPMGVVRASGKDVYEEESRSSTVSNSKIHSATSETRSPAPELAEVGIIPSPTPAGLDEVKGE